MEEDQEVEEQVFLDNRIYQEETKSVDLGHKKCTKMKTSRRVFFPPGRPTKEEAGIETRVEM